MRGEGEMLKMPIQHLKSGYRWGSSGKLYRRLADARKQGIAILISQGKIQINKRRSKNA